MTKKITERYTCANCGYVKNATHPMQGRIDECLETVRLSAGRAIANGVRLEQILVECLQAWRDANP